MSKTKKFKHNNIFIKIIIILLLVIAHIGFVKSISTIITNRSAMFKYATKSSQKFGKIVNIWNGRTRYYIDVESKDGFNDKTTFTFDVSYLEARELNINDIYKFETTTPIAPKSYNDFKNELRMVSYTLVPSIIISYIISIIIYRTFWVNNVTKIDNWLALSAYSSLIAVISMLVLLIHLITLV
jgi:hypothetical protein